MTIKKEPQDKTSAELAELMETKIMFEKMAAKWESEARVCQVSKEVLNICNSVHTKLKKSIAEIDKAIEALKLPELK